MARYYLRTSADDPQRDSSMFRSTVALLSLAGSEEAAAATAREVMTAWRDVLAAEAGDELTGDLIAALGDGIYLRAIAGEPSTALARDWDAVLARLIPPGG